MQTSLALVLLSGMLLGHVASRFHLPPLTGMLLAGLVLGPYSLNVLDPALLSISGDLRRLALVIILLRAGLALNPAELKGVGRSAILMCFLPALLEIGGMVLLAPLLFPVTVLEAAILGSVVAAVSPAVIVPRMLSLMERGCGTGKGVPQMILAGASVDDVFVIVVFTSLTALATGGSLSAASFARVPVAVVLGVCAGIAAGIGLSSLFRRFPMRDTAKVLTLLAVALLLVALEEALPALPLSGLVAVMAAGATLFRRCPQVAGCLSGRFNRLWVAAEVLLFVLVGAAVDIRYALWAGGKAVVLLLCVLVFRSAGVLLCLAGSSLNWRERWFCVIAYLPKATVQAAIGGVPLAMGLSCGPLVLTVAVLSILITAPLGALGIDWSHWRLLGGSRSG